MAGGINEIPLSDRANSLPRSIKACEANAFNVAPSTNDSANTSTNL